MIMIMTKQLWSWARIVLPGVGLSLMCIGVYLVSLPNEHRYGLIPASVMIIFGLLAMFIGVFWTLCHSMKSKLYQRGARQRHTHVFTVDRPSCFPPSYEESQRCHVSSSPVLETVIVVDGMDVVMTLAPPLYSQDDAEAPDCTWSWERPPPYSHLGCVQQGQVDAEQRRETLSTH